MNKHQQALQHAQELVDWVVSTGQTLAQAQLSVAETLRTLVAESEAVEPETIEWQQVYLDVADHLETTANGDPDADDLPHNQPDSHLDAAYEDRFTLEEGLAEWEEWR